MPTTTAAPVTKNASSQLAPNGATVPAAMYQGQGPATTALAQPAQAGTQVMAPGTVNDPTVAVARRPTGPVHQTTIADPNGLYQERRR